MSASLSKEYGFVVSSSADWALDLCTYPMSIMVILTLKLNFTKFFINPKFSRLLQVEFVQLFLENGQ